MPLPRPALDGPLDAAVGHSLGDVAEAPVTPTPTPTEPGRPTRVNPDPPAGPVAAWWWSWALGWGALEGPGGPNVAVCLL